MMLTTRSSHSPALALAALLAACATTPPAAVKQEPARAAHPRGSVLAHVGFGDSGVDDEAPVNGGTSETDALRLGLSVETIGKLLGGGMQIGMTLTDDDQLESTNSIDSRLLAFDFFPHVTICPRAPSHFRVPVRIGPRVDVHVVNVDTGFDDDSIEFYGFGTQFEVAPEVDFYRHPGEAMSVFVSGGLGAGFGRISTDDENYETVVTNVGFEAGLRFEASRFLLELAWVKRATDFDESDRADDNTIFAETEFEFEGVVLGFGIRW